MARHKAADTAATADSTTAADVTPFGEDPEELSPQEAALMESGEEQTDSTVRTEYSREEPEQAAQEERDSAREQRNFSDEQMHKLGPNDTVPAWSLVRERQENRELKRRLEEISAKLGEHEERWNRTSERLRALQERSAAEQDAAADPEPDPQADPAAHQNWELRQQRRALSILREQQDLSSAQNQALQQQAMLSNLEQQFILAGHPDYYDRVKFLRERRDRELALIGYGDPAERARLIGGEIAMIVSGAIRQGRNPAEVAYDLSENWGYKGRSEAAGEKSATEQVRDLQRKQAASQSLQAIAARPAEGPITLEDIAEMDDEAYERFLDKAGGDLAALLRQG